MREQIHLQLVLQKTIISNYEANHEMTNPFLDEPVPMG